jgi:dephospho-CoA kinase
VAQGFVDLGAALVDTDLIAHQLTAPHGAAIDAIRNLFGNAFINDDGRLDRPRMRQLVFDDPAQRKRLESVLHPQIRAASEAQIAAAHLAGAPYVLVAIPLLIESGELRKRVARVLVVDCPEAMQIDRVMQRSGLSRAQILAILQAQANRAQRLEAADDVIDNAGGIEALAVQVLALHQRYLALAASLRDHPGTSSASGAALAGQSSGIRCRDSRPRRVVDGSLP